MYSIITITHVLKHPSFVSLETTPFQIKYVFRGWGSDLGQRYNIQGCLCTCDEIIDSMVRALAG